MALALLPTVKNMLSGVCLSFHVAGTASIIRAVKTVQSLTIVTEWRINMSKKCVCGNDMVLDNEQAKQLVDYAVKKEVYNWDGVESVVAEALAHGNKVVINADW